MRKKTGAARRGLLLVLVAGVWAAAHFAMGQELDVRRLPAAGVQYPSGEANPYSGGTLQPPDPAGPAAAPVGYHQTQPYYPSAALLDDGPSSEPKIGDPRPGLFQKLNFQATWLPGGSFSGFGTTDVELSAAFAVPFPTRDHPLVITPGFEAHYLDGPASPDMPPQLYDGWLKLNAFGKITDVWAYDLVVTPGWHSDFQNGSGDALRITGSAFAAYSWSDSLQLLLGAIYLDRPDVGLLPAAGLIWTPDDDTRVELVVPRPRIARRWYADPTTEHWVYLAGEFGGGIWAVERAGGLRDVVTYSDFRVVLGWERKSAGGIGTLAEVGYVFGRQLQFESATPDFDPNDTLMVRVGAKY